MLSNQHMKYSFKDDYSEGCHPHILKKLIETNFEQTANANYGQDVFTKKAKALIHKKLNHPNAEIHLVSGGTQANLVVISSLLKPYEAVISAESGHIEVHETGAIEATGHKVLTIPTEDGKLSPSLIQPTLNAHKDEHQVLPRMVYISNATELGTIYSHLELKELSRFCKEKDLLLFMDGARLGTALTSSSNDLNLELIAKYMDVFYIGGTKNGALLGEAIVICNKELQNNFRFALKQKGALLAKGRLLGIQFLELFTDDLFFELGKYANRQAEVLSKAIEDKGFEFLAPTESNQVFPILPKELIQKLQEKYEFHIWQTYDETHDVIRLVTSWATPLDKVQEFIEDLED